MMRYFLLLAAYCVVASSAFAPALLHKPQSQSQPQPQQQQQQRSRIVLQGGASATSPAGKRATVESVKGLLDSSEMIFTVPASSLTVAQLARLRLSLPEGTTAKVVKNTLMHRALEGTDYAEGAGSMLKGANMWVFIEEDVGASIKAYNAFIKEEGKVETHSILGGVLEGKSYDTTGIAAIGELPTKQELYAAIAGRIKGVPTKVARIIKAPNSKLARAIKLATDENNKN